MNRTLFALLLIAPWLAAPLVAGAGDRFGFPMPPMPPHHERFVAGGFPDEALPLDPAQLVRLAQRLELSPEQRQAFGRIVDEAAPKLRDLMFRLQDSRRELDTALEEAGDDDAALRRIADEQGRLHADLLYLQAGTRAKLRALLNDEQRGQLEDGGFGFRGPMAWMRALHDRRDGE